MMATRSIMWDQHINVCLKEVLIQTDVCQDASLPNKFHLKGEESGGKAQEASGSEGHGLRKASRSKTFQSRHPFALSAPLRFLHQQRCHLPA